MPFTPYHFGPGLLGKSLAPRWYSMGTFMAVQVVIDVETLYHIVQRDEVLHDVLHTFIGATLVGLAMAAIIVWAVGLVRRFDTGTQLLEWAERVGLGGEVSPMGILVGGIVGGLTHPLFDGLMHADIRPFRPFTDANPLLGLISYRSVHDACDVAGLFGIAFILGRVVIEWRRRSRAPSAGEG
jgi:hypothetical protein